MLVDLVNAAVVLFPRLVIPQGVYVGLLLLAFVAANVRIYMSQEREIRSRDARIAQLEALEADIRLSGRDPELGLTEALFDRDGLPTKGTIEVVLEIENVGAKPGELSWSLDSAHLDLPSPFNLSQDDRPGFSIPLHAIAGQSRDLRLLIVPIAIDATTAKAFVDALNHADHYSITLRYQTRRIGGLSPARELVVTGSMARPKATISNQFQRLGHPDLAKAIIAQTLPA